MINFNTITEKQILYYTYESLSKRITQEWKRLEENPHNTISKYWVKKYELQLEEISNRIIHLESIKKI